MKTTEQPILCIKIAVLLCISHNRPVSCNDLNIVAALLEGPVVETRTQITCFVMVRKSSGLLITIFWPTGQLSNGEMSPGGGTEMNGPANMGVAPQGSFRNINSSY